jgi:uncharacterized protein YceH (UPF0502 family)
MPGTKEPRWAHLLSGEPALEAPAAEPARVDRVGTLEAEIGRLRADVDELRRQFAEFRRQFE